MPTVIMILLRDLAKSEYSTPNIQSAMIPRATRNRM